MRRSQDSLTGIVGWNVKRCLCSFFRFFPETSSRSVGFAWGTAVETAVGVAWRGEPELHTLQDFLSKVERSGSENKGNDGYAALGPITEHVWPKGRRIQA